ncbi:L,D-transpeptidase [Sphingomonas sp.]|uniref:L,D-transpeptidase family protein n=1 Tax=Sphingomonas sp. TaxID=28214 RepID=UPI002B53F5C3|nr:L,D-transpeptidase [Sphingomonas sp.]HWK37037.1 L,D-transpeptidase [Sphingomonas sp.]
MTPLPVAAQAVSAQAVAAPAPALDRSILHVQVILDHLGFSPGIIDGREGQSLRAALRGYQQARGLAVTGKIDTATLAALRAHRAIRPEARVTLTAEMLAGPFINPTPKDYGEQAKMPSLAYRSPAEKLAEMFHTSPKMLLELNGADAPVRAGATLVVPNVVPASRDYPADAKPEWRRTLQDLNVDARQPQAAKIVVDKSEGVLKVFDADEKLVAQFSATLGSGHDPLPIGKWKINGVDTNPRFHYNPKLFWDAKTGDSPEMLPPGPNGPVGVVWIDLSKPHYGIHGTPEPQTIGRTESHGCIRLTNWDAARLALMVKPGTPAEFRP